MDSICRKDHICHFNKIFFYHCGSVSVSVRELVEMKYVSKSDNSLKVVCKVSQTKFFHSGSCLIEVILTTAIHGQKLGQQYKKTHVNYPITYTTYILQLYTCCSSAGNLFTNYLQISMHK